ncbi:MAG: vanadium-dependent haloperoxidase [Anaerolineales bacterium]
MSRKLSWIFVFLMAILPVLTACQPQPAAKPTNDYSAGVATAWFMLQLQLIQETPGFSPPVASRALGYSGVTLYEAVVHGMPEYQSLVGQLNGLTALPLPTENQVYHWGAVANAAMGTITRALYPTASAENLAAINALEAHFANNFQKESSLEVLTASVEYGQALAQAIYEWSKTDGGDQGYATNFPATYSPPTGPGLWEPTPPNYQSALQPYWGENRPFVLAPEFTCQIAPPPEYSEDPTSAFYAEAYEVYQTVKNLTPEQKEIALFWADNPGQTFTPPGHSIYITTIVLAEQSASLALAAEAYAKVGMAVADAFIGCWKVKYVYNLLRPITYIQKVIDPTWNTPTVTDPVVTPPFPEYPSGHSVQSGATAVILTSLFGENYAFTDVSHTYLGMSARSFSSFDAAAQEAAISRLYGGIHYRAAIEQGLKQGRCIGEQILALAFKK